MKHTTSHKVTRTLSTLLTLTLVAHIAGGGGGVNLSLTAHAEYNETNNEWNDINALEPITAEDFNAVANRSAFIDKDGNWLGSATNLVGPQGPQGPQGETGPQGPAGTDGDDGALAGLTCSSGQVVMFDGNNWICTSSVSGKWSDVSDSGDIVYTGGKVGIGTDSPNAKLEVNGEIIQTGSTRRGYTHYQGGSAEKLYHYLGRVSSWCGAIGVEGQFESHNTTTRGTGNFDLSFARRGGLKVNGFASGLFGESLDIELYETEEGKATDFGLNLDVYLVTGTYAMTNINISQTPGCGEINTAEITPQEKSETSHDGEEPYYKLSTDGAAMFTDVNGNFGIGTTSPAAKLEVAGSGTRLSGTVYTSSLSQSILGWSNETKFLSEVNVGDYILFSDGQGGIVTAVNSDNSLKIDKSIYLSSGTTATVVSKPAIIVPQNAGFVGIGTSTPSALLEVAGTALATSWDNTSDSRLKKAVETIPSALEKILSLRGVTFEWKQEEFPERNFADGTQIGLIAQEVEAVFPELVSQGEYKAVSYANLVSPLIEAVKQLHALYQGHADRIALLEAQLQERDAELEAQNAELENHIAHQDERIAHQDELIVQLEVRLAALEAAQ